MPYIPVENTVSIEMIYSFNSQVCENVLHYRKGAAWSLSEATDLCDAIKAWWSATLDSYISVDVSLTQLRVTNLETQDGFVLNYGTGLPLPGAAAGASLPNNCCLVITKRTAKRGRSFRGRIYVPGMTETFVTGNTVTSGTVTGLVNAFNAMKAVTVGATTADMVVVSRFTGNAPRVTGVTEAITGFTSDGTIDSQRRRLPGRGA